MVGVLKHQNVIYMHLILSCMWWECKFEKMLPPHQCNYILDNLNALSNEEYNIHCTNANLCKNTGHSCVSQCAYSNVSYKKGKYFAAKLKPHKMDTEMLMNDPVVKRCTSIRPTIKYHI